MLDHTDVNGIPAFLRIPQATRAAAWVRNPPRPMPRFADVRREEEPATKALRAAVEAKERRKKDEATEEGLASLAAWKERQKAEKAELAVVQDEAREAQAAYQAGMAEEPEPIKRPTRVAKKTQPAKKRARKRKP